MSATAFLEDAFPNYLGNPYPHMLDRIVNGRGIFFNSTNSGFGKQHHDLILGDSAFNNTKIDGVCLSPEQLKMTIKNIPSAFYLWQEKNIPPMLTNLGCGMTKINGVTSIVDHDSNILKNCLNLCVKSVVPVCELLILIGDSSADTMMQLQHHISKASEEYFAYGVIPFLHIRVANHIPPEDTHALLNMLESWLDTLNVGQWVMVGLPLYVTELAYEQILNHPQVCRAVGYATEETKQPGIYRAMLRKNPYLSPITYSAIMEGVDIKDSPAIIHRTLSHNIESTYRAANHGT
jgi:hypothetical protein